jgi:hypothetical protein
MFKGTKINEFKTKALSKIDSVKKKASLAAFTTGVALEATGIPVFAAGGSTDANGSVLEIADMIINIFPLIGVFFVIAGAFKLFMAYRGNNPEDQSGAAKDIVIGAVFIAFRIFAWPTIKGII